MAKQTKNVNQKEHNKNNDVNQKKNSKRNVIIIIAVVIALLGAGGGILAWRLIANNKPTVKPNLKCVGEHCLINGGTEFNKKYKAGDAVELTLTVENETYMLPTLPEVTFGDRKAIYEEEYLYDFSTGKITFIMPEGEVNITASAIPPETEMTYVYDENKSEVGFMPQAITGSELTRQVDWGTGDGWKDISEQSISHDYKDDGAEAGDIFKIKVRNIHYIVFKAGDDKTIKPGNHLLTDIRYGNQIDNHISIGNSDTEYSLLETITIPNSCSPNVLTKTFQYSKKLKSIALPDSTVEKQDEEGFVSDNCFESCSDLESVVLPKQLKIIGSKMFLNCTKLIHINFPNELNEIKDEAFNNCSSLKKIVLHNKLIKIGANAFKNCTSLETIDLTAFVDPANVPEANQNAFSQISENATFYVSTNEMRKAFIEKGAGWPTDSNKYVVVNQ